MFRRLIAPIFMYGVRVPVGLCFSSAARRRAVIGRTEHAIPLSTIFRIDSTGIGISGPDIPQCVMMSTPASIAMSKLSTEVVCVCTVMPARCPSSTITRCTRSENEIRFMSTCPLAPYFRKSIPSVV